MAAVPPMAMYYTIDPSGSSLDQAPQKPRLGRPALIAMGMVAMGMVLICIPLLSSQSSAPLRSQLLMVKAGTSGLMTPSPVRHTMPKPRSPAPKTPNLYVRPNAVPNAPMKPKVPRGDIQTGAYIAGDVYTVPPLGLIPEVQHEIVMDSVKDLDQELKAVAFDLAEAPPLTEREKEMQEVILRLESRIDQLERHTEAMDKAMQRRGIHTAPQGPPPGERTLTWFDHVMLALGLFAVPYGIVTFAKAVRKANRDHEESLVRQELERQAEIRNFELMREKYSAKLGYRQMSRNDINGQTSP